jgi:N-acetyl-beta-hexosaminidase
VPQHVALGDLRKRLAYPCATSCSLMLNSLAEPPSGQLRFAAPATVNFTAGLLSAAAKMFPSTLFSTGGDELNTNCYVNDTETQKIFNQTGETFEQALSKFTVSTHAALEAEGKTPVVWEGASLFATAEGRARLTLGQRWCSHTTSR